MYLEIFLNMEPNLYVITYVRKLVMIGDTGVGKTSSICAIENYLLKQYKYDIKLIPNTNIIDFHVLRKENNHVFQIWDISGQGLKKTNLINLLPKIIFGTTNLIILMFSYSSIETFNNIFITNGWYDKVKNTLLEIGMWGITPIILIGNKLDEKHAIKESDVYKKIQLYNINEFISISALNNYNYSKFTKILNKYLDKSIIHFSFKFNTLKIKKKNNT